MIFPDRTDRVPLIEVRVVFRDGSQESRYWLPDDPHPDLAEIPDWAVEPRKSWSHPRDPVVFSMLVAPGRDDDAIGWLDSLPKARGSKGASRSQGLWP